MSRENYEEKYTRQWRKYFQHRYGFSPRCEICKELLTWEIGSKNIVHFDHKITHTPIKESPSGWIRWHPCNTKNIAIWEQCHFGILCRKCNISLPKPKNRKSWLLNALIYIR